MSGSTIYRSSISNKFISALVDTASPINLANVPGQAEVYNAIKIITDTPLYTYKSLQKIESYLTVDKVLILLDDSDNNFYYAYDPNSINLTGYAVGYVLKDKCVTTPYIWPAPYSSTKKLAKVVTSESKIFAIPSSVNVSSTKKASSLGLFDYSDIVEIVASPAYPTDKNEVTFVAVKVIRDNEDLIGYLDSRTLISLDDETIAPVPVANGSMRADATVYIDASLTQESETLSKNTPIKILNTTNGISKIQYFINDGNTQVVKTGYVKSSFVNDGNLTTIQIFGFILIVVSIIMAIVIAIIINKQKSRSKED